MNRIGLCLNPDALQGAGIVSKALRAFDARAGRTLGDAKVRAGKRRALMTQMAQVMRHGIPRQGIYPGFGPTPDTPTDEPAAVPIPKKSIDRLVDKLVRGITYIEDTKFIEPTHVIEPLVLAEESASEFHKALARFGKRYERPPGLIIDRCISPDDGVSSLYRIEIWGQFRVYATVTQAQRNAVA